MVYKVIITAKYTPKSILKRKMGLYVHTQKPFLAFVLLPKFCYRQGWKKKKVVNYRELSVSLHTSLMYSSAMLYSVRVFPTLHMIWCWFCGIGGYAVHHISAASCSSDVMVCRCVVEPFQPTFSTVFHPTCGLVFLQHNESACIRIVL